MKSLETILTKSMQFLILLFPTILLIGIWFYEDYSSLIVKIGLSDIVMVVLLLFGLMINDNYKSRG